MKFIAALTVEEQETLAEAYRNHPSFRVRQRAHAILLNNRRYVVTRLCELFETQHETVSSWLDDWESKGLIGLYDCPRSGRPSRYTEEERARFLAAVDENPHQPKTAAALLQEETGKNASYDTFKRVLKKAATSGNVVGSRQRVSGMKPPSCVTKNT
jgi:transposase